MNWPEKLYKFTKVQGAVTTYTFVQEKQLPNIQEPVGLYYSNYGQSYYVTRLDLTKYHTSLESCYEAWIESIEKFKQKVIKQFENKCKIDYEMYSTRKLLDENPEIKARMKDVLDRMNNGTYWSEKIDV